MSAVRVYLPRIRRTRGDVNLTGDKNSRTADLGFAISTAGFLWVASSVPGSLIEARQKIIIRRTGARQHDDGLVIMSSVGAWNRKDTAPLNSKRDAHTTGLESEGPYPGLELENSISVNPLVKEPAK
jgi:hypothetical protein